MRVETQRLLPGKDCRQQTLSHIDGVAERWNFYRIFSNAGMKI